MTSCPRTHRNKGEGEMSSPCRHSSLSQSDKPSNRINSEIMLASGTSSPRKKQGHTRLARVLSVLCIVPMTSAVAAAWTEVYRAGNGSNSNTQIQAVDFDSVERMDLLLKYRVRNTTWGHDTVQTMFGSCSNSTRGTDREQMYSVYPNTLAGDELKAVCSFAQRTDFTSAKSLDTEQQRPAPSADEDETPTAAVKRPKVAQTERLPASFGSGFVVSPTSILTNFHVVDGCKGYLVRRDTDIYRATLLATAQRSDLALLAVEGKLYPSPSIRVTAALGEDVVVAGHPLSGLLATDLIVTSGQVNSLAGLGNDPTLLQISAPVQPGNSGGPLIDRTGAIVGVVVSKVNVERLSKLTGDMAQNINFAIKPEVLRLFLAANRVAYKSATATKLVGGVEIAARARAFTVQVTCTN